MKLKPFRDYSEHEVINLFAAEEGDLEGGTFVQMADFDIDNQNSYGASVADLPTGAHTSNYIVNARVTKATAMTGVLGITLYDVKSTLPWLDVAAEFADPVRLAEQQAVVSGRAVPILKRGMVEVIGFSGAPYAGAAAVITGGELAVDAPGSTPRVGTWLSNSGVAGSAILQVEVVNAE